MKVVRALLLTIMLTACCGSAVAAVNVLRLGTDRGLSNNYIMDIARDRNGFIWVSTESGLNRFDGSGFRAFRKGGSNAPSANELNRIYADTTANVLWIATQRFGLDRLDCDSYTFTNYSPDAANPASIGSPGVTDVAPASAGGLWVATYTDGIDRLDPATGKFTHFNSRTVEGWPDDHVWTMAEGRAGKLYIGHVNGGFSVFDPASGKIENYRHDDADPNSLPGNGVRAVLPDASGNVWVGTDGGLALFNPATESFTSFRHNPARAASLISNNIYHLMLSTDKRLWISTENGGVSVLDLSTPLMMSPEEISFANITPESSTPFRLSNKTVHCTFEDSFGNIWIGTYGDGIDLIGSSEQPFGHTAMPKPVTAVAARGDSIFCGTDGDGLFLIAPGAEPREITAAPSALEGSSVLAVFTDSRGTVWLGTYDGRIALIPPGKVAPRILATPPSYDVRCIAENSEGEIIVGNAYGLLKFDAQGTLLATYYQGSGVTDEWVRTILARPDGSLWVGSFGGGVSVYSSDFKRIHEAATWTGLPTNTVNHLIGGPDGKVYAATGDGLVTLSPDAAVEAVTGTAEGLGDANVRALSLGADGRLWLSTGSGISVVEPDGSLANFGIADGIAGGDFSGACVTATGDGGLTFGSHFGLQLLDPSLTSPTTAPPPPTISSIRVYGNDVHKGESEIFAPKGKLSFPYDKNTLRISFNIPDASRASAVDYRYKVEGVDNRWYYVDSSTGIFLRNLAPGDYTLSIKASPRNNPEAASLTTLHFAVTPPLWSTWWARTIYVLLALAALFFGIRFYKKRLDLEYALTLERRNSRHEQELNAERLRFFTNITHELRTPLSLILGPLDDMRADPTLSPGHSRRITVIHKSAARLLELINSILEFRKTETQNRRLRVGHADLSRLVADIGHRYRELNANPAVNITIDIEEGGDFRLWHDPEVIAMIVDNLMSNACKYTVAGTVALKLYHSCESGVPFTEIAVSDTGIGMSADTLRHIFDRYYRDRSAETRLGTGIGLALVYNLVQLHEGEIFAESEPERGSTFRFRIHTDSTYPAAERRAEGYTEATASPAEPAAADKDAKPDADKPAVLVVEDNIDIINYIRSALADSYRVESATNGSEGLAMARELHPDIIISDIMMPKMDGISMVRALKTSPDTEFIPVIIATAKIAEEARREAYEAGADSYITKPFSSGLLRSRIANILAVRRHTVQAVIENKTAEAEPEANLVSKMSENDAEFIRRVSDIINANIAGENLDVGFIAEAMCMSHSTLYRKVKAITGLTVAGMIRRLRARAAAELLKSGRYTVSEIAFMVGMGSPGNFRQCFKEEFGVTPSEYKG